MLFILSPAKKQDFSSERLGLESTKPKLLDNTLELANILKNKSTKDLINLMNISNNIAELNYNRFKNFNINHDELNSKQAILAFKGDVYSFLQFDKYSNDNVDYLQNHFRILSGFYGILKPLDLIQPHRLEMGTNLSNSKGNDLYAYWRELVTNQINSDIKNTEFKYLINLASNEYWKVILENKINTPIITIIFKELRGGELKTIALNSKRARSMISNFVILNQINNPEDLKKFDVGNYKFDTQLSTDSEYYFIKS